MCFSPNDFFPVCLFVCLSVRLFFLQHIYFSFYIHGIPLRDHALEHLLCRCPHNVPFSFLTVVRFELPWPPKLRFTMYLLFVAYCTCLSIRIPSFMHFTPEVIYNFQKALMVEDFFLLYTKRDQINILREQVPGANLGKSGLSCQI